MSAEDQMNTPTPRTDRAWNTLGDDNAEAAWSFARTLERELANIRALANRRNKQDHSQDTTHQLVASLDQALDIAQAELAEARWLKGCAIKRSQELLSELAAERARLDWVFRNCRINIHDNIDIFSIHDREDLSVAMKDGAK